MPDPRHARVRHPYFLNLRFQFFRDNKIELPEEGWEWALDHAGTIALAAFALVSAALVMTGLKAVSPENGKKRKEK